MRRGALMPGLVPHLQVTSALPLPALHRLWQGSTRRVSIQTQPGNAGMMPAGLGDVGAKDG